MASRTRWGSGCLVLLLGACTARTLGPPDEGDRLARWAEPGCPYLTPWTDRSIRFVSDDDADTTWQPVLRESLPGARERRWWTLARPRPQARFEEISLEGCGLASWRGQEEHGGVMTGPYIAEIPPHPRDHGELVQADGSSATYRFAARRFEEGAARYADCFEIEVNAEQIGPGRYQARADVYCRDVGLVSRSIDGHAARRDDENPF